MYMLVTSYRKKNTDKLPKYTAVLTKAIAKHKVQSDVTSEFPKRVPKIKEENRLHST